VQQVIFLKPWYGAEDPVLREQYDRLSHTFQASEGFSGFHQLDEKTFRAFTASVAPLFEDAPSQEEEARSGKSQIIQSPRLKGVQEVRHCSADKPAMSARASRA
jgi:hypothetical protein